MSRVREERIDEYLWRDGIRNGIAICELVFQEQGKFMNITNKNQPGKTITKILQETRTLSNKKQLSKTSHTLAVHLVNIQALHSREHLSASELRPVTAERSRDVAGNCRRIVESIARRTV